MFFVAIATILFFVVFFVSASKLNNAVAAQHQLKTDHKNSNPDIGTAQFRSKHPSARLNPAPRCYFVKIHKLVTFVALLKMGLRVVQIELNRRIAQVAKLVDALL